MEKAASRPGCGLYLDQVIASVRLLHFISRSAVAQIVNDLPLGRSMDEILRLFDALQFTEEHGEVCPANWKKGDKGMTASPEGVEAYLSENASRL